ncbi:condensation domain-containing protein [Bacillus fungorum]|nr:condensation domain-containing protein [Bacillus fungorum]
MSNRDIAVIGLSGIFPDAKNLDEFYYNLSNGIDSVKELSVERKENSSIDPSIDYQIGGYLDRIDEFDYQFFRFSRSEAQNMDPHQRLLLQLVSSAIENAGYSLREFKGSRTAVILGAPGAPKPSYYQLITEFDPTAVPGNLHSVIAGRISHFFDLHSPAMVIDTACSSSLLAIYEGYNKLLMGEAECAIVGGINLNLDFPLKDQGDEVFGVESPDGKCKTFDSSANGIVGGEGGGIIILKSLEKAIKDGDSIHAVIKGGAANQDGGRSTGITAPSSGAQTEVITRAWELAGIEPETVSYIESHGTGTQIGDPIEIKGLTDAFKRYTEKRKFCAIGSLKTNIGHLAGAAGIASFIKVVLSLKNKKIFPSLNFHTPNPHIDFENTAVYVNTDLKDWEEQGRTRRAGVSSFGLSGTNVHLVLEEGPLLVREEEQKQEDHLITLSAKSAASLHRYGVNLLEYLQGETPQLTDIAYVLNRGRDDHMYRYAVTAAYKQELIQSLERDFKSPDEFRMTKESKVVFMFSHDVKAEQNQIDFLLSHYPLFKKIYTECLKVAGEQADHYNVKKLIYQYSLYQLWRSHGISSNKIIGNGVGNLVAKVISKEISLPDGIQCAVELGTVKPLGADKLRLLASKLSKAGYLLYLEVGAQGILSREMNKLTAQLAHLSVFSSFTSKTSFSLSRTLSAMYAQGLKINWDKYYQSAQLQRVEVPTYPFEKIRCWVEAPRPFEKSIGHAKTTVKDAYHCRVTGENVSATEEALARLWGEVLKLDEISVEDNFFELGGNSLNGSRVMGRIKKSFGVEIAFEDVYEYSTLRELSKYIDSLELTVPVAQQELASATDLNEIIPMKDGEEASLSFAQQSLWFLDQLEEGSALYNVPLAIRLKGELNQEVLQKSLCEVVKRHDTLRSTFPVVNGMPSVEVQSVTDSILTIQHLQGFYPEDQEAEVQKRIDVESKIPFNLAEGPIFRASLLVLDDDEHVLLVTMHHIVSDGWSIHVFIRELVTLYNTLVKGEEAALAALPIQYYDFANWQRKYLQGKPLEKLLNYWQAKLDQAPLLLDLPLDYERPTVQNFQGASYSFKMEAELTEKLRKFSKQEEATLFMILLAAWKTLLYRYSGQEDIVVASPVAGRQVETEGLIGLFINTLALRSDLSGNPRFRDFLKNVRQTTLEAFSHQQLPFFKLLDALKVPRSSSYSPLVQVMFDYHNHKSLTKDVELLGLDMQFINTNTEMAKFDLCMTLAEGDEEILGIMEYSTSLFDEPTIELLMKRFFTLIEYILQHPETQLLDIKMEKTAVSVPAGEQIANDELDDFDFD